MFPLVFMRKTYFWLITVPPVQWLSHQHIINQLNQIHCFLVLSQISLCWQMDLNWQFSVRWNMRVILEYYPMTIFVAELGDNAAIFGLDFMESNAVILRLSTGKLMVGNETVNLHREYAEKGCYRISLCETLLILSRSCGWLRWMWTLGKLLANLTRGKWIALWNVYPLLLDLQG